MFGTVAVEVDDLPPLYGLDGIAIVGTKYVWRPSPALVDNLPAGFEFPIRCMISPDGLRRFYPSSYEGMIAKGFQSGLAILSKLYSLSSSQRFAYRAMYLFFERVRRTRERFGNDLLNATSLRVSKMGRDLAEVRDILPATLGLNATGDGEKWGMGQLLKEGRTDASAGGIAQPDEADCLRYGLVAGARLDPLYLHDDEMPPLVRMALYESIPCDVEKIRKAELHRYVVQRALTAISEHTRDPAANFTAWFAGPNNSFVQQIAKRKRVPGGVLDASLVRRVLQDLGWDAYRYVADCLRAQMWLFALQLPEPLSAAEWTWFRQMNFPQPYFGNLPFALVIERRQLIGNVVWEIWQNPGDTEPVAVLHRLLDYYAQMASARRDIDRRVQQRRDSKRSSGGRIPLVMPLASQLSAANESDDAEGGEESSEDDSHTETDGVVNSSAASANTAVADLVADMAEMIRDRNQIRCRCVAPTWVVKIISQDASEATIEHTCTTCDFSTDSTLPLAQLAELATDALLG